MNSSIRVGFIVKKTFKDKNEKPLKELIPRGGD